MSLYVITEHFLPLINPRTGRPEKKTRINLWHCAAESLNEAILLVQGHRAHVHGATYTGEPVLGNVAEHACRDFNIDASITRKEQP